MVGFYNDEVRAYVRDNLAELAVLTHKGADVREVVAGMLALCVGLTCDSPEEVSRLEGATMAEGVQSLLRWVQLVEQTPEGSA